MPSTTQLRFDGITAGMAVTVDRIDGGRATVDNAQAPSFILEAGDQIQTQAGLRFGLLNINAAPPDQIIAVDGPNMDLIEAEFFNSVDPYYDEDQAWIVDLGLDNGILTLRG